MPPDDMCDNGGEMLFFLQGNWRTCHSCCAETAKCLKDAPVANMLVNASSHIEPYYADI